MGKWDLGKVATITMGQSPSSETYNADGVGLPFYQGKADFGLVYPSVRVYCNQPQKVAQADDVLISVRAPVGATNIADSECCIGRGLAAITASPNISFHKYIFYFLRYYEKRIEEMGVGSTFKAISRKDVETIQIPLPPLPIQQKIADVLDRANALIEKRKAQIEKLDLLVKSRFVEMFDYISKNKYNFPIVRLDEICDKITDGKHGGCELEFGSKYFFIGAREIYNNKINYNTAQEITYSDFIESYRRCNIEIGDFVIVNTGATIGKTAIATDQRTSQTLLQKSVALFKVKKNLLLPRFLQYCYIINTKIYKVESASAQPNLLLSKIKGTEITLPPFELQNRFADFVQAVEKSKAELRQGLDKMEMMYKSLMQKCFTGEMYEN